MSTTRNARSFALLLTLLAAGTSGCVSLRFGPSATGDDDFFQMHGIANAHGGIVAWREHPSYGVELLSGFSHGEVASIDIGPVVGVGVGLAGFRFHLWPLEFGIGTLFYDAEAASHRWALPPENAEQFRDVEDTSNREPAEPPRSGASRDTSRRDGAR
ncbi:MAG: hypothetical protein IPM29_12805 [Planctomycetes bacterium]|nr:hypothetical protein [Planctomycetota bacterium]